MCYRISNIFIGLVVYFYELIVYMLLERNAFDSIAFFSQCSHGHSVYIYLSLTMKRDTKIAVKTMHFITIQISIIHKIELKLELRACI